MSLPFGFGEFHFQLFSVRRQSEEVRAWLGLNGHVANANGVLDEPLYALSSLHEAQINPQRLLNSCFADVQNRRHAVPCPGC
jgi:hypothetical protein